VKILVFEEIVVNQFLQSFSFPLLDLFFNLITYFGNPAPWFFVGAILFWLGKEKKSFKLVSLLLFASFFSGILKYIIARPRPTGVIAMTFEATPSMPSTHATVAGAISAFAYFSKEVQNKYAHLLIALALLTGISRIYLGVHFLTDVLAGLLLGALIGWFVFKLEAKLNQMHFHITKLEEEIFVLIFFILVIILYLFVPQEFYAAYALLGYFGGYAVYRHTDMKELLAKPQTTFQSAASVLLGLWILGTLGIVAYFTKGLLSQVAFFIAGIFVTFLWPMTITRIIIKRKWIGESKTAQNPPKKIISKKIKSKTKKISKKNDFFKAKLKL
jgi:undecaprenyl-diphosphatase